MTSHSDTKAGAAIKAAIVDYEMGNLYSVARACEWAGMTSVLASSARDLAAADIVVLPGVGAFGDAMAALRRQDLVNPLRDIAQSGKPLIGICLGLQLLMSESREFGSHAGLGILEGSVIRFESPRSERGALKAPQVGWNRIFRPSGRGGESSGPQPEGDRWKDTPLEGLTDGEFMYFVHSYYAVPLDERVTLAETRYGQIVFCSALRKGNVYGFQFHPERSAAAGLRIYRGVAAIAERVRESAA